MWHRHITLTAIFALSSLLLACQRERDQVPMDSGRAGKAMIVIRGKPKLIGGSRCTWYEVRVLDVLKNTSGKPVPSVLEAAQSCWELSIPENTRTLYLVPYNAGDLSKGWALLPGDDSSEKTPWRKQQ